MVKFFLDEISIWCLVSVWKCEGQGELFSVIKKMYLSTIRKEPYRWMVAAEQCVVSVFISTVKVQTKARIAIIAALKSHRLSSNTCICIRLYTSTQRIPYCEN